MISPKGGQQSPIHQAEGAVGRMGTDAGRIRAAMVVGMTTLATMYLAIWLLARPVLPLLRQLWFLPEIGLLGALIANTSGTGGGVVFVPVFSILRAAGTMTLSPVQVVATSFLIQCFGMSMGALRWSAGLYRRDTGSTSRIRRDYWRGVDIVLLGALPTMLATQRLARFDPHAVLLAFKCFSILLGALVVATTWTVNRRRLPRPSLLVGDLVALAALGVLGGFVTALFSVGVGEIVALYLFVRHYPVVLCTGAAVTISALSVLAGAPFHVFRGEVVWEAVVLAALGAVIGGYVARPVALWIGPNWLKTLDGGWIVVSSLYLLAINAN